MNELSNKAVSAVKIEYIETQDYREREEIEIRKKPINSLYNTQTRVWKSYIFFEISSHIKWLRENSLNKEKFFDDKKE